MASRDSTRKITYSAVCVAIALAVILVSQFSPVRIVPLIVASLAFYVAFVRCGVVYGVLTLAVSVTLCFFISGITATFIFLCIVFAPFALLAYFMRKLSYRVFWQAVLRLAITAVFFAAAFVVVLLLADYVAGTSLSTIVERVGKVWTAVIIVIIALPVDLFFSVGAERVVNMLK